MVKTHKLLLDQGASNVPGKTMSPKYITLHNTANATSGADAHMHAKYQRNGSGGRQASWHYQVDDTEIWQSLKDNQQGWHAGDGSGTGNTQSIGIEICENCDGDFDKAVKNAQWLIKKLMDSHEIPLKNVVTHKHWSGKNCPHKLLSTWDDFKAGIGNDKPKSRPKKNKPKSSNKGTYKGNSIVDYLVSIKEDSSFSHREKLAKKHGINNYKGTASQNKQLLNAMRKGGSKPSKPPYVGKRVEAIVPHVNYYNSARWSNPSGQFTKGQGWTIVDKITTDGSPQYKVKNSKGHVYYITARKDLVKVK